MRLAGLDLATTSGWAVFDNGSPLTAGKFKSVGTTDGQVFSAFRLWLRGFLIAERIEHVAIEEPLRSDLSRTEINFDGGVFGARTHKTKVPITNMSTLRRLYGLAAHAHAVCHDLGIPVEEINQRTWRSAFLGSVAPPKGTGDRTAWWKDQALQQCKRLGLDLKSKDAADAVGVCFALAGRLKQERVLTGDLFKTG